MEMDFIIIIRLFRTLAKPVLRIVSDKVWHYAPVNVNPHRRTGYTTAFRQDPVHAVRSDTIEGCHAIRAQLHFEINMYVETIKISK